MDWLKKAANWLSNKVYQASGQVPGGRDALRNVGRAANQVNRQVQRYQPQVKRAFQQATAPRPSLDYQAAMRALQAMQKQGQRQQQILRNANPTNITKPFLGVTLGDIGREIPSSATGTLKGIGTAATTIPGKIAGITPALIQYANDNPLQRGLSRSGGKILYKKNDAQINRRLQNDKQFINKYVVPEAYSISNNLDTKGRNISFLKANQREQPAAAAGEMIGNMAIDLGANAVAPGAAPLYYATKYGGDTGRTVYNATGDANVANRAGFTTGLAQAALAKFSADQLLKPGQGIVRNLITKPLVGASGAAGERMITNAVDKTTYDPNRSIFQGVPEAALTGGAFGLVLGGANQLASKGGKTVQPGKTGNVRYTNRVIDDAVTKYQAGALDEPQLRRLLTDHYQITYGKNPTSADLDGYYKFSEGSSKTLAQQAMDKALSTQRGPVRTVNGKKVFAPNYQPEVTPTGKLGKFNQNFNEPDAKGRFTANELPGRISHVTNAKNAEAILKSGALKQSKVPLDGVEGARGVSFAGAKDAKLFGWGGEDNVRFEYKTSDVKRLGKLKVGKQGTFPEGSLPADVPNKYIRAAYAGTPETAAKLKAAGVKNVYIDPELNLKGKGPVKNTFDGDLTPQVGKTYQVPATNKTDVTKLSDRDLQNFAKQGYTEIRDTFGNVRPIKKLAPETLDSRIAPYKLASDTVYHGTSADNTQAILKDGFKKGSELPKTAFRGGGYGELKQDSISFSTSPKQASVFGATAGQGSVLEAKLKPGAKVVTVKGIDYAEDLNDILPSLKKKGIDAVYLPGEKEVVVINKGAVKPTGKSQSFKATDAKNTTFFGEAPQVGKTDPLEALKAEARKYKSADEFVSKRQTAEDINLPADRTVRLFNEAGIPVKSGDEVITLYHGTNAKGMKGISESGTIKPGSFFATDKAASDRFAFGKDGGVMELKVRAKDVPMVQRSMANAGGASTQNVAKLVKGKDGVWRAEELPTRQQLTDLYNQANEGPSMLGKGRIGNDVPKSYLEPDAPKGKLTAKEKAMGKALGLSEADTLAAKANSPEPALSREYNLDGTQIVPGAPKGQSKRGFVKSLQDDWGVPSKVADELPQGYKPITNADTFAKAKEFVDADPSGLQRLLTKPKSEITELDQAQLQIHLRKAIEADNFDGAKRIATKIDVNARQAGRTVQILAAWKKTTPEGALSEAYKVVDEANAKYPGKNFEVSPEKAQNIRKLAENIQKTTAGTRERQVAQALLEKEIRGIIPATIGRKISSLQTFSQLLNPKTAIRNIIGNAVFSGMENVSTTIAAGTDKLIGLGTKQRSVALPSLKTQGKGFIKGVKYGVEDTKLGIRTSGSETQFEIKPNVFKNKLLKGVEKTLGYELSVPDKAFYQAAFEDSLNNQMRAMKLNKPNALVIEQANQEALYRTFQNDSKLASILSGVKRGLNMGKEFGAGDFVLKYPRTPGNIAQAGLVDYSPIGVARGALNLGRGVKQGNLDPFSQREAALQIGRGITGTGLLGAGYGLAKAGVLQGRPETDKDVNNLDRSVGGGPYTFNVSAVGRGFKGGNQPGDKIVNYDWLQPTAIPITVGANIANRKGVGDTTKNIVGAIDAGVQTVVDQPVLQGLARYFQSTGTQGKGIGQTALEGLQTAPSSFTPSILNQIGQYTDKTSRSTYSPNFIEGMINQVKGRVPGLRKDLQPQMDTFGNERQMYEDNNFFNVFFNPAFQRTYKPTPEAQLVIDLNNRTGETSQYPRVAPRKLTVNGQQTTLTPQQITDYQRFTGERTKAWYQSFDSDPRFQNLSDEDKIKVMQNALTDIAAAGKIKVLGQTPDGASSRVKAIAEDQAADFIPKPKAVKQPKAPKSPRAKKSRKTGTGRARRARVAKSVTRVPKLSSGIRSSGISRVNARRTPRLKFAKTPRSGKTVKIKV